MRLQTTILALVVCLLADLGCSKDSTALTGNTNNEESLAQAKPATGDPPASNALQHEAASANSPLRFPKDKTVGNWVSSGETINGVTFTEIRFQPKMPNPDWGYVPVQAMGHTLSVNVSNRTKRHLANVELEVTATDRKTKKKLAELTTDSMLPYFMVPPNSTVHRTIELTFGKNGEEDSPFADAESWREFEVSIRIRRIRLVDEI